MIISPIQTKYFVYDLQILTFEKVEILTHYIKLLVILVYFAWNKIKIDSNGYVAY